MLNKFKHSGLFWLWISALVIVLDQWTKQSVAQNFSLYESVPVTSFFNLSFAINKGSAFSFLANQGGWQLWFFSGIAVAVTGLLCYWLSHQTKQQRLLNIGYCLIIGGALGNVIDRVIYGYVIDFLDFYWKTYHYPTFNVADIAISLGAAFMIIDALLQGKQNSSAHNNKDHQA